MNKMNSRLNQVRRRFGEWKRRWYSRCQLIGLSDGDLHDIGLSRYDALQEAAKPFWRQ